MKPQLKIVKRRSGDRPEDVIVHDIELVGSNGEVMWYNGQGYTKRADALRAIRAIRRATSTAEIVDEDRTTS